MKTKKFPKNGMNFIIDLAVYPFDIMVSIGQSDAAVKSALKRKLPDECYNDIQNDPILTFKNKTTTARTIHLLECGQTVIRLRKKPETPFEYGVINHEIFHAVYYIMIKITMPLSNKSQEAYAYLIGYITAEIYKRIFR